MIYQDTDVVVTGADGMLGRAVVKALRANDYYRVRFISGEMDISNVIDVIRLTGAKVINCAGIVRGRDDVTAKRMGEVNALAPHMLAAVAKRLIHVSTDCVFDGTKGPYVESDEPNPTDNYGMSKLMGEVETSPSLTVRTSFVGFGQRGLLRWLLDRHSELPVILGYELSEWNGLYVGTVARVLVRLLDDPVTGILHIQGPEINKYQLLKLMAEALQLGIRVAPVKSHRKNMILKSERLVWGDAPDTTFSWDTMIEELKADHEVEQANQMLASGGDPEGAPGIGI